MDKNIMPNFSGTLVCRFFFFTAVDGAFAALPCTTEEALGVEVRVELVHALHFNSGQHAADCVFHWGVF